MGKRVGFVGLGNMGKPMSLNLLKKGVDLTVFEVRSEAMEDLLARGAKGAESPKTLAAQVDVVITMLPGPPEIREAVLGATGLVTGLRPQSVLIDMSTSSPTLTKELAQRLAEIQCEVLDAPVTRGIPAAESGTLTIMVGGNRAALETCRDLLEAMGSEILYIGNHGMGHAMKLVNQLISHTELVAICEAFALGTRAGLEPQTIFDVVTRASGNSFIFQYKAPRIVHHNYEPGFTVDLLYKDLDLAAGLGRELGVPLFLTNLAVQVGQAARALGLSKKDGASMVTLYEKPLDRSSEAAGPSTT